MMADTESVASNASEPLLAEGPPHFDQIDIEHTEYIIQTGQYHTHTYTYIHVPEPINMNSATYTVIIKTKTGFSFSSL